MEEMRSLVSVPWEVPEQMHLFISLFPVSLKIQMISRFAVHWPFSNGCSEANKSWGLRTHVHMVHHMSSVPGNVTSSL